MVIAGIDSTGNTAGFLMYHLANNPEAQERLRREVEHFGPHLTATNLGKMPYFRACLKESFRCTPTVQSVQRILSKDLCLKGFHIPKGTLFLVNWEVLHRDERFFPNAAAFRPERWMKEEQARAGNTIHPFLVQQFSYGPRMCIGKRFAELEIQVLITKLVQNFRLEWAGRDDRPLETVFHLFNTPDGELKFRFRDT